MKLFQLLSLIASNWPWVLASVVLFTGMGIACSAWWYLPAGVAAVALAVTGIVVLLSGSPQ